MSKIVYFAVGAFMLYGCNAARNAPTISYAPPTTNGQVILHMVVSYSPEKRIERIYPTQRQAVDYINNYSGNHDYYYEAHELGADGM